MKKKTVIWIAVFVLLAVICGMLAWRMFYLKRMENLSRCISTAWGETYEDDMPEYLKALAWESLYQLDGYEKGDPWVLTVTVMGVDLAAELRKADLSIFTADSTEREIDAFLVSLVKQAAPTRITTYLYAWPENDGFRIEFSETFIDAMSGKVYSYAKEALLEQMGGGLG